jgi:2,3-bisphosphoglycerate-independent phosphoglycerate mutase
VSAAIQQSYATGVTDEFMKPIINASIDREDAKIKNGDAVICFNFRTDRCREITEVLSQKISPNKT